MMGNLLQGVIAVGLLATAAEARAVAVPPAVAVTSPALQYVQYYEPDYRVREEWRRRREIELRRREEWRRHEEWRRIHDYPPPPPPGFREPPPPPPPGYYGPRY